MHQPEFFRNEDVWDDDEERTRGRDPFPVAVGDITNVGDNDVRLGYHVNVIRDRPALIQGSVNSTVDFVHGGSSDFFHAINVMVLSGTAGDPGIERHGVVHPLQPDPHPDHPAVYSRALTVFDVLTMQLNMVIFPTERVMKMMSEDEHTAPLFCKLKVKLKPREVHDWSMLVMMMASLYPVPSEKRSKMASGNVFSRRFGLMHPGVLSVRRAALMLIGPRGFVNGWGGTLPRIRRQILSPPTISYVCPADWGPDTFSDGNSSYCSNSPGCEGDDSDPDFGGPRGVVRMRPAVSGVTSDSSGPSDGTVHLKMFPNGGPKEPNGRKLMKRFVKYARTSNRERRERRDIRRERRLLRSRYDPQRRLAEPLFDMEVRRAEALAAERKRNEINYKNQKVAREKEFKRIHQAVHSEPVSDADQVVMDSTMSQCRYKKFLSGVRTKVIKRWTEQADRRIIDLQRQLENNEEEMNFLSWVSPVHWVTQTGPNCGLAVLAMAARPVTVCEVARDLSVGGHEAINSTMSLSECKKKLKVTKLRTLKSDVTNRKICCEITSPPLTIFPPEITELQYEAVMKNYSSRGEMFSALAMGKLAYAHRVGQYKVHLVNRDLWNEYENKKLNKKQIEMEANNAVHEKYFGIEDFDEILSANHNMCVQDMDIDDVPLSIRMNDNFSSTDQEMSANEENSPPPSLLQQNEEFVENSALPSLLQEDDEFEGDFSLLYDDGQSDESKFEYCQPKEKIDITDDCGVIVSPNNPLWKMSVVKHLMSGNRIAVCYDCDKNMKPSLNNNGSTAHWAIMCGVIVGKVYSKKKYDNKETGYLYMYDKNNRDLKPMDYMSRNNIIEGTVNTGYLFDDPLRRIVSERPPNTNANGGNIDVEVDCVKDVGTEYDKYCGDVKAYNDIMHNVDLNNVWVVVQHGKNMGNFDVLYLDQVAKSNQQLKLPNEKILSCFWSWNDDEDTTQKLLQSLSSASLFGSKYQSSFVNDNSSTNVLQNRNHNSCINLNLKLEFNEAEFLSLPPPPPPLPPPPPPVIKPKRSRPYLPFVLPEGVRLDNCLAQRFLIFKPIRPPYFVSNIKHEKFNLCPNQRKNGPQALDPLMCFFSFDTFTLE